MESFVTAFQPFVRAAEILFADEDGFIDQCFKWIYGSHNGMLTDYISISCDKLRKRLREKKIKELGN